MSEELQQVQEEQAPNTEVQQEEVVEKDGHHPHQKLKN